MLLVQGERQPKSLPQWTWSELQYSKPSWGVVELREGVRGTGQGACCPGVAGVSQWAFNHFISSRDHKAGGKVLNSGSPFGGGHFDIRAHYSVTFSFHPCPLQALMGFPGARGCLWACMLVPRLFLILVGKSQRNGVCCISSSILF